MTSTHSICLADGSGVSAIQHFVVPSTAYPTFVILFPHLTRSALDARNPDIQSLLWTLVSFFFGLVLGAICGVASANYFIRKQFTKALVYFLVPLGGTIAQQNIPTIIDVIPGEFTVVFMISYVGWFIPFALSTIIRHR